METRSALLWAVHQICEHTSNTRYIITHPIYTVSLSDCGQLTAGYIALTILGLWLIIFAAALYIHYTTYGAIMLRTAALFLKLMRQWQELCNNIDCVHIALVKNALCPFVTFHLTRMLMPNFAFVQILLCTLSNKVKDICQSIDLFFISYLRINFV